MTEPLEENLGQQPSLELLELILKYRDGELTADEVSQLAARIQSDPETRRQFISASVQASLLHEIVRWEFYSDPELRIGDVPSSSDAQIADRGFSRARRLLMILGGMVLMLAAVGLPWLMNQPLSGPPGAGTGPVVKMPEILSNVQLVEAVHAQFFERATPALGSPLLLQVDYLLQQGIVRLKFPAGATAIIEGPAMFRVENERTLNLGAGACSVHAPPGAEGFCVNTPRGTVIDRGTRFVVTVSDIDETEIHVADGEADLFPTVSREGRQAGDSPAGTSVSSSKGVPLYTRQAARMPSEAGTHEESIQFDPELYKHQLPDRIVRYEATRDSQGFAEELVSVSVQRGGRLQTYQADELIPIEVTWFHGDARTDRSGHLADGWQRPARPGDGLEDRKLSTGFMNIGGQVLPLTTDPVMKPASESTGEPVETGTPGLGIRFRSPVINHAGPDVVLFELQSFMQPWDGDAFHVSPVHFRPGLKTVTIRQFDLSMHSQESLEIPSFWRHRFLQPVRSLAELASLPSRIDPGPQQVRFRATAVGIDLSEMGYAEGEQVEELFLQHAIPEDRYVITERISKLDPVLIAGFPALARDE